MKKTIAFVVLCLATGWAWAAPAFAHDGEPGYRKHQIHAIQAWARLNPIPDRPAAVYFTLHNESAVRDALIGVSTPMARRAAIHQHVVRADGQMVMHPISSVPVAPSDVVLFEPGGFHVMLFHLTTIPKPGTTFPLTLRYAKGGTQTIPVTVRSAGVPQNHSHKHH